MDMSDSDEEDFPEADQDLKQDHIIHEGWLKKRGNSFPYSWQRRYVELHNDKKFYYFTDETKKTKKGEGSLAAIQSIDTPGNTHLTITTPKRTWYFDCETPHGRFTWKTKFIKAYEAKPKTLKRSKIKSKANNRFTRRKLTVNMDETVLTTRRGKILEEILDTETTYQEQLDDLINLYIKPMTSKTNIPKYLAQVFGYAKELYELHTKLLGELEKMVQGTKDDIILVGKLFLKWVPRFKMYSNYIISHAINVDLLAQLKPKIK
eukprot:UN24700